jgi:hypothetical protein
VKLASAPRLGALVAVALLFALLAALAQLERFDLLRHVGVPPMRPSFADVRAVTGACESVRLGFDPMLANPGDPWGRPFNYPRVWLLLEPLGVGNEHAELLAVLLWLAAAAGLTWLASQVDRPAASVGFAILAVSPPFAFALERANTDLLMFALLAAAAFALRRRPWLSAALVGGASVLKLFPALAFVVFIRRASSARNAGSVVAFAYAAYLLVSSDQLAPIAANTQHEASLSYGVALAPNAAARVLGWPRELTWALALGLLAALGLGAALLSRRVLAPAVSAGQEAALRVGAAVYLGTFLLGSNFDYRLLFLVFVAPALGVWASCDSRAARWLARATLAAASLCVWRPLWARMIELAPHGEPAVRALDELVCWGCWALLSLVLAATLRAEFSGGGSAAGSSP